MVNEQEFYLFGQIQTSQTGGQPYSDTSPYKVSEWSLAVWLVNKTKTEVNKNNMCTHVKSQ